MTGNNFDKIFIGAILIIVSVSFALGYGAGKYL